MCAQRVLGHGVQAVERASPERGTGPDAHVVRDAAGLMRIRRAAAAPDADANSDANTDADAARPRGWRLAHDRRVLR